MKNQKQTKKNNAAAKKPTNGKPAAAPQKPLDMSHRVLTMADYRAMEKVAHAIGTMCKMRRKYVNAMQAATECIDRNLDKLREIVWSDAK